VTTNLGGSREGAHGIAVQPDGKIIVVGSSNLLGEDDFAVVRYDIEPTCPEMPSAICQTWPHGFLLVDDRHFYVGQARMAVRFRQGPALGVSDFGNPLNPGGTAYTLCVYDDADRLVGGVKVDRAGDSCLDGPCWSEVGSSPAGYQYKDADLLSDGAQLLTLRAGAADRSLIVFKGTTDERAGERDLPRFIPERLVATSSVKIQLFGSDMPACFSVTLSDITERPSCGRCIAPPLLFIAR